MNNGIFTYHVDAVQKDGNAVSVVEESPLGLTRKDQNFTSGLTFVSQSDVTTIDETYSMLIGKQTAIRNNGVERAFTFANQNGARLQIVIRAYADGVAFRYRFPEQSGYLHCVTAESTGFKLQMGGKAWLTVSPLAKTLGFVSLPPLYWLFLAIMLLGYAILTGG